MNRQKYKQQLIEIDLKELVWRLLTQWKAVLIVSLFMALLFCGAKHIQDVNAYKAEVEAANNKKVEQSNLTDMEQINAIMEALPENERATVSLIVSEREWVANQKKYLNESVLMKTDSTNQRVLKMVFKVDAEDKSTLPALMHDYSVYVCGDEVIGAIKPLIDENAENKYISELFYTEENKTIESEIEENSAAFEINLVLPESSDATAITTAIETAFKEHCKKLNYVHSISCFGAEDQHIYHKLNADRRIAIYNNLNTLEYNLRTNEGTLTGNQLAAVNAIMAIKNRIDSEEIIEEESPAEAIAAPGWSKKYAVLGFLLGLFAYAFVYAAIMVLRGRVESASNLSRTTNARMIGEVYCDREVKGIEKLFHSKAIERLRYQEKFSAYDQIEKTTQSLIALCKHAETTNLALFAFKDSAISSLEKETTEMIKNKVQEEGIVIQSIEVPDVFEEKNLLGVKNAIVSITPDAKLAKVDKLTSLFSDYDITQIGNIYISEK